MKIRFACVMFILLFLSPLTVSADSEAEIRAAFEYLEQVWNEGDLEAIRGHYGSDFVFYSDSEELNLKQRIEDFAVVMEEGNDRGSLEFSNIQIRPMGEEHVLAWGQSRLSFKDGTELGSRFSSVYKKTPFGWKVVFTHN